MRIAKPCNNADVAIAAKPGGTGPQLANEVRSAVSRRLAMGAYHWLRVASCISSRQASVATTRGLCRGSLIELCGNGAFANCRHHRWLAGFLQDVLCFRGEQEPDELRRFFHVLGHPRDDSRIA